jgi:glutaminyl-peptide cyclotransferase
VFSPSLRSTSVFAGLLLVLTAGALHVTAQFRTGQAQGSIPLYTYRIVKTYPHDRDAFTQGLIYLNGFLYEGTGLNGKSTLRKVKLETGQVVQEKPIEERFFGEGITEWGNDLIQLTWQTGVGFVWDRGTFARKKEFRYAGEGWGLTHDDKQLIMSDGSPVLRYLDPVTLAEKGRLVVLEGRRPVANLNELEWVKGEIWANIWQTHRIARISPATGQVIGWIEMSGLLTDRELMDVDVLNGIAYDAKTDRIFVTGKLWPKLFEIKVVSK